MGQCARCGAEGTTTSLQVPGMEPTAPVCSKCLNLALKQVKSLARETDMPQITGTVEKLSYGFDKERNPLVRIVIETKNLEGALDLYKDEEVVIQSRQGKLALAKE